MFKLMDRENADKFLDIVGLGRKQRTFTNVMLQEVRGLLYEFALLREAIYNSKVYNRYNKICIWNIQSQFELHAHNPF